MNEPTKTLAVLIIEDVESDAQLIVRLFKKADYELVYEQVETAEQMRAALDRRAWDIVISDYKLPQFDGRAALKLLQEMRRDIPFIVVSGTIGEETAVAMMKAGAHDYLVKGDLARLVPAVERELEQSAIRRARKQAEEALVESEIKFRWLYEYAPMAYHLLTPDGTITDVNHRWCEALGYSKKEAIGKAIFDFMVDEEKEEAKASFEKKKRSEQPFVDGSERKFLTKDGAVRIFKTYDFFVLDQKQNIIAVQTTIEDITERRQAEEALRDSEQRYKMVSELASDYVYKIGVAADGKISLDFVTDSFYSITGRSIEQARTIESWSSIFHPDDLGKAMEFLHRLIITRQASELQCRSYIGNNQMRWIEVIARPEWGEQENRVTAIIGAVKDITARKQAEEALIDSEERYRSLFDRMLDGMYRSTHAGKFVDVNAAMVKMFGYSSKEEMLEVDIKKVLYFEPDERGSHILDTGQQEIEIYRMRRKDGSEIWVEDHGYYVHDKQGEIVLHEGLMRDVTERVQAENARAASAAELRALIEQAPNTVYTESAETQKVMYISPQVEKLTGYTSAEWIEDKDLWKKIIHPADVDAIVAMNDNTRLTHNPFRVEYRILTRDGRTLWIHDEAVIIENQDGTALSWQGVMYDVTERVQAEKARAASAAELRALIEQAPTTVYTESAETRETLYISPQVEKLTGYTSAEWTKDRDLWKQLIHPEDLAALLAEDERTNANHQPFNIEYRILTRDGRIRWLRDEAVMIKNQDGTPAFWQGVMYDITERVQAEKARAASEAELRALFASMQDVVMVIDRDGMYREIAPTKPGLLVKPADELLGKNLRDVFSADQAETFISAVRQVLDTKQTSQIEYKLLIGSQSVWFETSISPMDKDSTLWVARDVSRRKQADETLRESEERQRLIFESLPVAIFSSPVNANYDTTWISGDVKKITGFDNDEYVSENDFWRKRLHPEDKERVLNAYKNFPLNGEMILEYRWKCKDGQYHWFYDRAILLGNESKNEYLGVIVDVTERKQAEEVTRQQSEQLSLLYEASQRLNRTLDPHEIYQTICDFISNIAPNDSFIISAFDPETQLITCRAYWIENKWLDVSSFPSIPLEAEGKGTQSLVIRSGQSVLINDYQAQAKTAQNSYAVNSETNEVNKEIPPDEEITRSALIVPLKIGGRVTGVIQLLSYSLNAYTENQLKLLDALALHIASAEQNALLYTRVQTELNERMRAQETLRASEERYHGLFNSMIDGFALHEIICDENGKPVDYRFLEVNPAYERLTGFQAADLIGKTALEVLPNTESYWIDIYGNVALTGRSTFFENYSKELGRHFEVSTYCPKPGQFAAIMMDISERKRAEQAIHQRVTELETLYQSGLALSQLLSPKEIAQKILELLEEKLDWHHTRIRLYHPQDDSLELLDFNQPGLTDKMERHEAVKRFQPLITNSSQGISGWVVRHGQTVRSADVRNDPRYIEANPSIRSGLYVPMKLGERILGVIGVASEQADAFSEAEERLVSTLANQAASAFENARLFNETRQRVTELETLYQSGLALSQSLEPKEIGQKILELLEEKLDWHHTRIRLYHPQDDSLELLDFNQPGLKGEMERHEAVERFQPLITNSSQGISGWVIRHGQTVRSGDVRNDPRYVEAYPDIHSGLYVPMKLGEQILGVISIESEQADAFNEADERLIGTLANQAASAFENARLFDVIRKRAQEMETLNRIALVLRVESKQAEMLKIILDEALAILNAKDGSIELWDEASGNLQKTILRGWFDKIIEPPQNSDEGIVGKVFSSGEYYITREFASDPETRAESRSQAPPGWGGICLPIRTTHKTLGVLIVSVPSAYELSRDEIRLLSILAEMTGAALQRIQLYEETARRAEELTALQAMALDISSPNPLSELLYLIVERAANLIGASGGGLYLTEPEHRRVRCVVSYKTKQDFTDTLLDYGVGAAGYVAETGEPIIIDDYRAWSNRAGVYEDKQPFQAVMSAPMLWQGNVSGVIHLLRDDSLRNFSQEELNLLTMFANHAAVAVENARLLDSTQQHVSELTVLHRIGQTLLAARLDPELIYNAVHQAVTQIMPCEAFVIVLDDEDGGDYHAVYFFDKGERFAPQRLPRGTGLSGHVISSDESLLVNDLLSENDLPMHHFGSQEKVRSILAVPLRKGAEIIGMLSTQSYQEHAFSAAQCLLLETISAQLATAIDNANLYQQTQARLKELQALYKVSVSLRTAQTLEEVLPILLDETLSALETDSGSIMLYQPASGELRDYLSRGWLKEVENISIKVGEGVAGTVFASGQSYCADEFIRDPLPHPISQAKIPAGWGGACLPIRAGSESVGVFFVSVRLPRQITPGQMKLLDSLVEIAGATLHRMRLYNETARRAEEFASLYETSKIFSAENELDSLLQSIVQHAQILLHSSSSGIYLYDQKHQELELAVYTSARIPIGARLQLGNGAAGHVAQTRQPLRIDDYSTWEGRSQQYTDITFHAVLNVPMLYGGELVGVLTVDETNDSTRKFTEADERLLTLFASQAAGAIRSTRLYEETARRAEEFASLYETSKIFSAENELNSLLQSIVEHAQTLLHSASSGIYLYDEQHQEVEMAVYTAAYIPIGTRLGLGESVAGRVAQTRQPLRIDDYSTWESRSTKFESTPFSAVLDVPMLYGGELIGVLTANETGDSTRKFSEADERLLTLFASQAAGAIHSARLHEETARRAEEFASLYETSKILSAENDLNALLQNIVDHAQTLLHSGSSGIYLYDPACDELEVVVDTNPAPYAVIGARLKLGEGTAGRVAQTRQPMHIDDYSVWEGRSARYANIPFHAVLEVPMLYGGELIGVLAADETGDSTRKFTEADERLLTLFASQAAGAIRSARLHKETVHRLELLQALRVVDQAISSSLDMRLTLDILLTHTLTQLNVDAADVLLFHIDSNLLELMAGRGFYTLLLENVNFRDSLAGRAIMEYRTVTVSDLEIAALGENQQFEKFWKEEKFSACWCVPLIVKGEARGVLEVYRRTASAPDSEWLEFLETLAGQAAITIDNTQLFDNLQRANMDLILAYNATIEGWSRAMEMRDNETEGHTQRVADLTMTIAKAMGLPSQEMIHIRRGALLHDIGKMGIPDKILLKRDTLTDEEWVIMRTHPQLARDMLMPIAYLREALVIPYCHHENWDGTGYPQGLKGRQIPLTARLFAVVDVWDALTSNRSYRKKWTKKKTLAYIQEQRGKRFDPQVVDAFLKIVK